MLLGQAQLAELCLTDNPRRELILAVWSCSVSLVFLYGLGEEQTTSVSSPSFGRLTAACTALLGTAQSPSPIQSATLQCLALHIVGTAEATHVDSHSCCSPSLWTQGSTLPWFAGPSPAPPSKCTLPTTWRRASPRQQMLFVKVTPLPSWLHASVHAWFAVLCCQKQNSSAQPSVPAIFA